MKIATFSACRGALTGQVRFWHFGDIPVYGAPSALGEKRPTRCIARGQILTKADIRRRWKWSTSRAPCHLFTFRAASMSRC